VTTTRGRAACFELPGQELSAATRIQQLKLVVVTLQIPHELLHLNRRFVGKLQDFVPTFLIQERIERETNSGTTPEESSLTSGLFCSGISVSTVATGCAMASVVSAVVAAARSSCDVRQNRRFPFD
jgi:cytochrome c biogenesis protein CcdA